MFDSLLPYAPLFTPAVGSIAALIAVSAIGAQKSIARKRASIDFFLKTDLDHNMLDAHAGFVAALKKLKEHAAGGGTVKGFVENPVTSPDYERILRYLNVHELIAVGIKNGVFDDRVCYNFWSDGMVRHVGDAASAIQYEIDCGSEAAFFELRRLSSKWAAKIDRWNRKQKRSVTRV
jgi:Domain of unknown function (DUF4760)